MGRGGVCRSNMLLHLGRRSGVGSTESSSGLICKLFLGRKEAGISSQNKVATKTNTPTPTPTPTTSSGNKKTVVGQVLQEDHSTSSSPYSCCWVPHPRTGIYFPVGHDWVMEDVPDGAATFSEPCCFRN